MRKFQFRLLIVPFFLFFFFAQSVLAQGKVFTAAELSTYNGKNGAKAYTSYKGIVYDVTDSKLWQLGEHFGLQAGIDLTEAMQNAPHGPEVFSGFKQVGTLEGYTPAPDASNAESGGQNTQTPEQSNTTAQPVETTSANGTGEAGAENPVLAEETQKSTPWYAKRIRIAGISLLGWTGILLGIFFVLTFATCFALPWAKLPLPWTGSKIGKDPLDESGTHLVWSSIHKYFVWFTVIFGIIHGILGFLQLVGIYI